MNAYQRLLNSMKPFIKNKDTEGLVKILVKERAVPFNNACEEAMYKEKNHLDTVDVCKISYYTPTYGSRISLC